MNLAIDIGNTRVKIAVFEDNKLSKVVKATSENFLENLKLILASSAKKPKTILSSVGSLTEEDHNWLKAHTELTTLTHQARLPFQNCYATPHTLGIDRLTLAAGAALSFPQGNKLIIDAGTCITYDFLNEHNDYLGGAISPGLQLRFKSLNDYTADLPLLTAEPIDYLIGTNTKQAILSGVTNGLIYEIEHTIQEYQRLYPKLSIILTGGDTLFLAERLKNTIFANPNFLLESLHKLHQYILNND